MAIANVNDEPEFPPEEPQDEERHQPAAVHQYGCPDAYAGIANVRLSEEQRAALAEPVPDEELDILPTGEVYPSQVVVRRILNRVFGPGQWALMPRGPFIAVGGTLTREYALFVNGCFVGEAMGEQDFIESNDRQSYGTACEGVKSNALKRCCKDLGIASQCWDKRQADEWKRRMAARFPVKQRDGKIKQLWRRLDAEPFPYEVQGGATNPSMEPQRKSEAQRPAQTAQPAQQAQAKPAAAPGGQDGQTVAEGLMERDVYEKTTAKGTMRYAIKLGGQWYATFDTKVAEFARVCFANGEPIRIHYHETQYGRDIDKLELA